MLQILGISKISRHSPLDGKMMILRRLWSRDPRTRCLWDRSSSEISEARRRWKKMKRRYRWSRFFLPADASRDQEAEKYARFSVQTPRWPKLTDWQTTSRHEPNQQQATPPPLSTREAWEALSYFAFFFFSFFSSLQLASTLASRRPKASPRFFDSSFDVSTTYARNLRPEFSQEARKIAVFCHLCCFFFSFFGCRGKMLKGLGEIVEASFRGGGQAKKEKMFRRRDGRCWEVRELGKFLYDTGAKSSV